MRGYYLKDPILARGKKVSIGIDVHKESWQVTAISQGEELFHGRIPGDYSALRKLLDRFVGCQIRVAYEAGPCLGWLTQKPPMCRGMFSGQRSLP